MSDRPGVALARRIRRGLDVLTPPARRARRSCSGVTWRSSGHIPATRLARAVSVGLVIRPTLDLERLHGLDPVAAVAPDSHRRQAPLSGEPVDLRRRTPNGLTLWRPRDRVGSPPPLGKRGPTCARSSWPQLSRRSAPPGSPFRPPPPSIPISRFSKTRASTYCRTSAYSRSGEGSTIHSITTTGSVVTMPGAGSCRPRRRGVGGSFTSTVRSVALATSSTGATFRHHDFRLNVTGGSGDFNGVAGKWVFENLNESGTKTLDSFSLVR